MYVITRSLSIETTRMVDFRHEDRYRGRQNPARVSSPGPSGPVIAGPVHVWSLFVAPRSVAAASVAVRGKDGSVIVLREHAVLV